MLNLLLTSVSNLVAGGSSGSESASVTGHSSGTMYYGACVDSVSGESDTANNCSVGRSVAVTPTNPPSNNNCTVTSNVIEIAEGSSCTIHLRLYRNII